VGSGLDGSDVTGKVNGHLDYLSQLAGQLGVDDPVESFLTPLVGRWSDLHDEAQRWRTAAAAAEDVTQRLKSPLGGLDAAWQGTDANSFLDYMQRVGLAGNDLSDAMTAMADALDKTANGIRQIVSEMTDMLADTADQSSDAMTVPGAGQSRAKQHVSSVSEPAGQMHDSVRDILSAFTKLCEGVQGGQSFAAVTMSHKMPAQNWAAPAVAAPRTVSTVPVSSPVSGQPVAPQSAPVHHAAAAVPPATHAAAAHTAAAHPPAGAGGSTSSSQAMPSHAATAAAGQGAAAAAHAAAPAAPPQQLSPGAQSGAMVDPTTGSMSGQLPVGDAAGGGDAAAGGQQQGGSSGGMGSMGGMRGGGGQGGDQQHKSKIRIAGDIKDIFGKPDRTAPPTIGA
jgi:uncharacterized protein YukE